MTLPDGVTAKDVKRYSKLAGVVKALDKKHGRGKWGDREVATYILERRAKKLAESESLPGRALPTFVPPETHQQRLDEYLASYDRITPNDRQSFNAMVTLELNMEKIQAQLATSLEPVDRQKLSDAYTSLSREHRQLQDALGIGRARRKSEASAQDEIEKLRAGAIRFMDKHTIKITCRACRTGINLGFVAYHFKDHVPWKFQSVCPKCSQPISLEGMLELPQPPAPVVHTIPD